MDNLSRVTIQHCFQDPKAAIGAWILGLLQPRDLPDVATEFLARGLDGRYLRELAGASVIDRADTNEMFERAIQELGWEVPDRPAAATAYALCVSRLILSGEVTPYDGARALWDASVEVDDTSFHDLDPFIYASSEYDDRPQDRAMIDGWVVEEAQRWVDKA